MSERPHVQSFEEGSSCSSCGADTEWAECWKCCGEGCFDDFEYDPINSTPGEYTLCDLCDGDGGWCKCPTHGFLLPDQDKAGFVSKIDTQVVRK